MSRILKISHGDYIVTVPDGNEIKFDSGPTGNVRIAGNLIVEGSTTEVSSTITTIADNVLILNNGETGDGITLGTAGISIDRGTLGSANILFDEAESAFVLSTSLDSDSTAAALHASTIKLNTVSSYTNSHIIFNLTNDLDTTVKINTPFGQPYYNRALEENSVITKRYLENYVSAESGHATVNQIFQALNGSTQSQVLATDQSINFYIENTLISDIKSTGLSVNNISSITGNLTLTSNLDSSYNLSVTGLVTLNPSTTAGSINNVNIGLTTPKDGKFTNLAVTTDIIIPVGSTLERPETTSGTTPAGKLRYNTTIKSFEGWNGELWGTVGGGLQSSPGIVTTNYTALANNLVRADTTNGTITITLPNAPNDGDVVGIIDVANTFGDQGKSLIVVPGANGTIENDSSVILDLSGTFISFVYIKDVTNWKIEQTPTGSSSGSAGLTISNSRVISRATTTSATPTALTFDGAAPTAANQLILPNDSTFTFSILVTARRTDVDNESAGYKFEGVIDRNSIASTTNFVGTPIKTTLAEDSAAWDCDISVDTVNGGLRITAIGETDKTIKWVAVCNTAEVTG